MAPQTWTDYFFGFLPMPHTGVPVADSCVDRICTTS
jgi:hypothetical protein